MAGWKAPILWKGHSVDVATSPDSRIGVWERTTKTDSFCRWEGKAQGS